MKKTKISFSIVLGTLFVLGLVFVGYLLFSGQSLNFDLRRQATGEQLAVELTSSSTKIKSNQAFTVDLKINTQGKFISGVQMVGSITGADQDKSRLIVSQITGLNPVFSEMKKDGDKLQFKIVELATLGSEAFTTHDQMQKIATLSLYPPKSGEIKITLDQNQSGAMEFEKSFLTSSVGQTTYNIEIDDGTGGASAPDQGIHRSCNEYCADSRECATQYSCYYNRCRNPKNLTEEKCTDPIVITKPKPTPTALPKGGATTPTPKPLTATATVIITSAADTETTGTKSTSMASTDYAVSPIKITPSPTPTLRPIKASPTPTPTIATKDSGKVINLPLIIVAMVLTGIIGLTAAFFILRNWNSRN